LTTTVEDRVLTMRDVAFSYAQAEVLRHVSLEVAACEIAVLIGRNGAGKSTLLRCAAGWSSPGEGQVEILGQSLREGDRQLRRELVLVTDTPPFYDDLTAREHLQFVLRANHMEQRVAEAERLLDAFGLRDAAGAYPSTYSRGMRYKLALVLALALRPRLLLLDEPFGPIDAVSARELWQELRALASAGSAVLLSVHQLPEDAAPDRYFVLDGGVIVEGGTWVGLGADCATTLDGLLRSGMESAEPAHDA
jgi:ABC-2 type transport system ATP-binding protein